MVKSWLIEGDQVNETRISSVDLDGEELIVLSWPVVARPELSSMTDAEQEILGMLLERRTQRDMASARGTSARTVANQVASIYRKLGVSGRVELLARLATGA